MEKNNQHIFRHLLKKLKINENFVVFFDSNGFLSLNYLSFIQTTCK